jgi:dipeptidase E
MIANTRILAISSSRSGPSGYLESAAPLIKKFLKDAHHIAFIPFASVDSHYQRYTERVREAMKGLKPEIHTVLPEDAETVLKDCDAIMVGGGNTFKLLHDIQHWHLEDLILGKVKTGVPYIGWSAGANITGPAIGTTNDMPVIEPQSFKALGIFPFQINPHYINLETEGFNGETRDQRLEEYLQMNAGITIVGLPEGTALQQEGGSLKFMGDKPGILFRKDQTAPSVSRSAIDPGADLTYLL